VEASRPKFDYAYQIVDGGTENSVGNGDGIIQYGESFDLVLTVRNSGKGTASQVQIRLTLLQKVSRRSSSSRGVNIFGDTGAARPCYAIVAKRCRDYIH